MEERPGASLCPPNRHCPKFRYPDAEGGYVVVEVLDKDRKVIPGFSSENCQWIVDDDLRHQVHWKGTEFSKIDQPIRLRFLMKYAKLFSFRIAEDKRRR